MDRSRPCHRIPIPPTLHEDHRKVGVHQRTVPAHGLIRSRVATQLSWHLPVKWVLVGCRIKPPIARSFVRSVPPKQAANVRCEHPQKSDAFSPWSVRYPTSSRPDLRPKRPSHGGRARANQNHGTARRLGPSPETCTVQIHQPPQLPKTFTALRRNTPLGPTRQHHCPRNPDSARESVPSTAQLHVATAPPRCALLRAWAGC